MGILLLQENKDWIINLKEEWIVATKKDLDDLIDFLCDHLIEFELSYSEKGITVLFNNVKRKFNVKTVSDFERYKETIKILLDYKKKFGQVKWK